MADTEQPDVAALTVQLLSAYLANNTIEHAELATLIRTTKQALTEAVAPAAPEPAAETHTPAVSIRKSLASDDHILSLIDGRRYKTLKRHLAANGLSPQTYRERYNLPSDYPMVARAFADARRAIAERIGLGHRSSSAKPVEKPGEKLVEKPVATPAAPSAPVKAATAPTSAATKSKAAKAPAPAKAAPKVAAPKAAPAAAASPKPAASPAASAPAETMAKPAEAAAKPAARAKTQPAKAAPRRKATNGTLKLFTPKPADATAPQASADAKATRPAPRKAKPATDA